MRIGVLGGGQLGQMLAQAGTRLGHSFRFFDPDPEACARSEGEHVCAAYEDERALARFCDGLDLATFEFENVPVACAEFVAQRVPMHPSPGSLRLTQDRVHEKEWFERCAFETAPWRAVDSAASLVAAVAAVGVPGILKSRRGGYDGKGQARVDNASGAMAAWESIGHVPAIYEKRIAFQRELSLIVARSPVGELAWCPLVENTHAGGILRTTRAPATGVDEAVERLARDHAQRLVEDLGHVGVFTIELFQCEGGRLLANETAPRVHNSGHWTIEGAPTSQFENHLRAITGERPGSMVPVTPSAMVNLIGRIPDAVRAVREPGVFLHDYGKAPRAGRKVGHITIAGRSGPDTDALVARVLALIAADGQNEARYPSMMAP